MPRQDPDELLVAIFKNLAKKNEIKSLEAGRPIFDDVEIVEIRAPGSKDVKVFPATEISRDHPGTEDPATGELIQLTYAERFRHQYQQFKAQATQTKSGTPLAHAPFLTEARRAELRAQNIYTVEALAAIEGAELKNLGIGGREMKNQAMEYIAEASRGAGDLKLAAELEAIKVRNAILEEDMQRLKEQQGTATAGLASPGDEGKYEGMSDAQLREYITVHSGHGPVGQPSRKNLIRMAQQCTADEAV